MNDLQIMEVIEEITPLTEPGDVVNLIGLIKQRRANLKELQDKAEAALIAILETKPGRLVTVGAVRYCVGDKRTTKCRSNKAVADELYRAAMEAEAGDYEKGCARFMAMLMDCLCSDAFKPGESYTQLHDAAIAAEPDADDHAWDNVADAAWARAFEVKTKKEIKEGEEKPVRELRTINPMFMEKRRR